MDNFLLQAIVDEAAPQLLGERLGKIYQPNETDLIIDFRISKSKSLIVSTDSEHLAVYLGERPSDETSSRQRVLPPFAARLRKLLGSARLNRLEKLGDDRVIDLDFKAIDDNGTAVVRRLVLSLIGRSADVYLIEDDSIVASLRGRETPGETYAQPAPVGDRLDPFDLPDQTWITLIATANGSVATAARRLLGFTPTYCQELEFLAAEIGPVEGLHQLLNDLSRRPSTPVIYSTVPLDKLAQDPGLEQAGFTLAPTRLLHLEHKVVTHFQSVSEAAERYYGLLERQRTFLARQQALASQLRMQLKKQRSLREKLTHELTQCGQADRHQRLGDILLANLHQAVKTDETFVVTDYFAPGEPMISIPAAQHSDALAAATHFFKQARKSRHGVVAISARLPIVNDVIASLERALSTTMLATSFADLDGVSLPRSLAAHTKTPRRTSAKSPQSERVAGVRRYRSSDGLEILVGRTDRDNDNLTLKVAKSSDLWFHAADYPGSHVVLRNPMRKTIPTGSIREAAELAAKFSQAKGDSKVAVNYCERKFVSKPKGFAPGQVRLSSFKTILVEPREAAERLM